MISLVADEIPVNNAVYKNLERHTWFNNVLNLYYTGPFLYNIINVFFMISSMCLYKVSEQYELYWCCCEVNQLGTNTVRIVTSTLCQVTLTKS